MKPFLSAPSIRKDSSPSKKSRGGKIFLGKGAFHVPAISGGRVSSITMGGHGWRPVRSSGLRRASLRLLHTLDSTSEGVPFYPRGSECAHALQGEVDKLLMKGAVEIVHDLFPAFYRWLFLVEKATDGWRPVIDLSPLIGFVVLAKFSMKTVVSVLALVRKGDFMLSVDLKIAYFQIPIFAESHLFLHFVVHRKVYQFKTLCFSLSVAP